MNRRDLIKTALSLPLVQATRGWSSICGTSCTNSSVIPYQIILEGPFGIILHEDTASPPNVTGITAFMPADPDGRHRFMLGGQVQDVSKQFSLSLTQTPHPSTALCVDSAFADFCVDGTTASPGSKALLKIEMAVPTRIIAETNFKPMNVVFKSNKTGKMQRSFVLEYDLNNGTQLQLTEQLSGLNIPLPDKKLMVEVGLDKHDPDSADFDHAKKFYNTTLLPLFGLDASPDHIVSSIKGPSLSKKTTTYECKAGGIIGGTTP